MIEVIPGARRNRTAADSLVRALAGWDEVGTLYLGYPILSTIDEAVLVDAILVSRSRGVTVFNFITPDQESDKRRMDSVYLALKSRLLSYPPVCENLDVATPVTVVLYGPGGNKRDVAPHMTAEEDTLTEVLGTIPGMDASYLVPLNAVIQRVTNIRRPKRRRSAKADSKGATASRIEEEIANLDIWQKRAAVETPEGPQRIRGIAGSGKTIVLALKAAYLHAFNPDWNICVTFYTRSLYAQFQDLIRRFYFEEKKEEPNWERLRIMHAWGGKNDPGVYRDVCQRYGVSPYDYGSASARWGRDAAFGSACQALLDTVAATDQGPEPLYDVVLVDEAQDLPPAFLRILYHVTTAPKRLIWAYDELQNLNELQMPPLGELFGTDAEGAPLVVLDNQPGEPSQDIILPVCYRNTPWALALAHALGFGVYRESGLVQFFDDASMWNDVGYEIVNGRLSPGHDVTIVRREECSPGFFRELLTAGDAVRVQRFDTERQQAEWVVSAINNDIRDHGLLPSDILVIFPNAVTVGSKAPLYMSLLDNHGINSHIAGVTSSRDEMFIEGSVALSGVYRAKGNEAPAVYVVDAQYCVGLDAVSGLIKRRNTLFTAITRSRAWVSICGWGGAMDALDDEIRKVVDHGWRLSFAVPSAEELGRLRTIHRDRSASEARAFNSAQRSLRRLLDDIDSGRVLPGEVDDLLKELMSRIRPDESQ